MKKISITFVIFLYGIVGYNQVPVSGNYNGLSIAIDSINKTITGYYENKTGENEKFSCLFLFTGNFKTFNDKSIEVTSFFPGNNTKIPGKIIGKNMTDFSLILDDDHGGCWNVQTFKEDPIDFSLIKKENWIDIKIVKSDKVFFCTSPDETKKSKAYVLKGDCLKVLQCSGNWLKVVYEASKNTVGWIKSQDCY